MLVSQKVNLRNYTASSDFLGHFQLTERRVDRFAAVRQAIKHFHSCLSSALPLELVTSLFTDETELQTMYEVSDGTIQKYVSPLAKKGWLNLVDYDKHDEATWRRLETDLRRFSHLGDADTKLLSTTVMTVPGINGHCFFVNERSGLIVYPHEDIGFGVVADKRSEGYRIAEHFLKSVPHGYFEFFVNES